MSNQRETAERVAAAIMDRIEMDRAIHKSALADVIEASMARITPPMFVVEADRFGVLTSLSAASAEFGTITSLSRADLSD